VSRFDHAAFIDDAHEHLEIGEIHGLKPMFEL
jgi:hypothetical protein